MGFSTAPAKLSVAPEAPVNVTFAGQAEVAKPSSSASPREMRLVLAPVSTSAQQRTPLMMTAMV